ncbi:MAG: alpha/beta hydrolase [Rickettsiaceae bacterium]|jgi:alpha/beta superfamily hydrolase|nr:alpha/beta hydrolase [Rickettsiaceae bacterium]
MPEVFFNGPAGRIEGQFAESPNPRAPIALVLHPHPKFGGTMNNKVVYNVYKTLFEHGFTVLRINFRGVGRSLGEYDDGIGEMTDAATALDWLQINYPMSKLNLIAGFSFGAWIAMQLIMRRPEITNFLAISPPVNKYDFTFLSPCPIPGLILQGDKDSVVSEESVGELASRLSKQKNIDVNYRVIAGADHFFRDKIDLLNEEIRDYLKLTFSHQLIKSTVKNASTSELLQSPPKKVFLD